MRGSCDPDAAQRVALRKAVRCRAISAFTRVFDALWPRLLATRRNRDPGSAKRHEECRIAPGTRGSVIAGLDPAIHPHRKTLCEVDGYAGLRLAEGASAPQADQAPV